MIVTCPGCASKYRVRNEAVPAEGARMRCPKCETLFLAKPPAGGGGGDDEFGSVPQSGQTPMIAPTSNTNTGSLPVASATPTVPPGFGPPPWSPPAQAAPAPAPIFGAPPSQPPSPSPFGAAPSPSPFGAAPSPFGPPTSPPSFAPAPSPLPSFGGPPPSPLPSFGGPPSPSSSASIFGPPPQTQPPQPTQPPAAPAGPVTAMMRTFDESMLSSGPSTSAPPQNFGPSPGIAPAMKKADDDPFAKLDIGPGPPEATRPRPSTQAPQRSPTQAPTPASPPPVRPVRGPSMAATIGSWVFLVLSIAGCVFGLTFAGWTSESLDLDDALMAKFEGSFGVRPPKSFTGGDDPELDDLRRQAQAKEAAGDLAGAAVAWKRVQARDPADKTATAALPRVMTALGERLR